MSLISFPESLHESYQIWETGRAWNAYWHEDWSWSRSGWVIESHLATDFPTQIEAERIVELRKLKNAVVVFKRAETHYRLVEE